jgi:hypothetical protein
MQYIYIWSLAEGKGRGEVSMIFFVHALLSTRVDPRYTASLIIPPPQEKGMLYKFFLL